MWTYLFGGPYQDAAALREALAADERSEQHLVFTLLTLPDEHPAGVAAYARIKPEHGVIEIGEIWFAPALRRTRGHRGHLLTGGHAFDELGYRRLEWKCDALNRASRRAAERFGFRFEGVFRQHMVIKGHNRDTAWYAITDDEWPAIRGAFEAWLSPENFDEAGRQRRRLGELTAQPVTVSAESNKRLVRRLVDEAIARRDPDIIDEIATGAFARAAKQWVSPFRSAFPDFEMEAVELIAEGDTVVAHFRCSGTHRGEWLGVPATGRRFEAVDEIYIFRIKDDKLCSAIGVEDNLTRMRQLGLRVTGVEPA